MKFSLKERREKENLERFMFELSRLNPGKSFIPKKKNPYQIQSDLTLSDLLFISLPDGAIFSKKPDFTANAYGLVMVSYKKKDYTIFGKGYERNY